MSNDFLIHSITLWAIFLNFPFELVRGSGSLDSHPAVVGSTLANVGSRLKFTWCCWWWWCWWLWWWCGWICLWRAFVSSVDGIPIQVQSRMPLGVRSPALSISLFCSSDLIFSFALLCLSRCLPNAVTSNRRESLFGANTLENRWPIETVVTLNG